MVEVWRAHIDHQCRRRTLASFLPSLQPVSYDVMCYHFLVHEADAWTINLNVSMHRALYVNMLTRLDDYPNWFATYAA